MITQVDTAINTEETFSGVPEENLKNESLASVISEYEIFIKSLQNQIEMYKTEHESLRLDILKLVEENSILSDQLKSAQAYNLPEGSVTVCQYKLEEIENLQAQLAHVTQEKETIREMWHASTREVEDLEQQLKSCKDERCIETAYTEVENLKLKYSEAIQLLESRLTSVRNDLNIERKKQKDAEAELSLIKFKYESTNHLLESKEEDLKKALKDLTELDKLNHTLLRKTKDLEAEVSTDKGVIKELELALGACHEKMEHFSSKYAEACEKVSEGLYLVETVCSQRDAAVSEGNKIKEECARLHVAIKELIDDAGEKVQEEMKLLKKHYNQKIDTVLQDMKKLDDELQEKKILLKQEKEGRLAVEEQLRHLTDDYSALYHPQEMMTEKKIQALLQEVNKLHKTNSKIRSERDNLLLEVRRIEKRFSAELNKKQHELETLEGCLKTLKSQAGNVLESQLNALDKDVKDKANRDLEYMKLVQERRELSADLQEVRRQATEITNELQRHLESQHSIKDKWKEASKSMCCMYEARIKDLKHELHALKHRNQVLEKTVKHNIRKNSSRY